MSHRNALRTPLWLSITGALLLLSGCATTQGTQGTAVDDEGDPLEGMNRAIYTFNENVDKVFFKPLATGYKNTLPQPVRTSVANFFNNLSYPIVILNDFLQAKFSQGLLDTGRFVMNSSVGVLGLFDVATTMDMPAHNEDFGQTLGFWGAGEGPYLVLPFFGPSNVRDGFGLAVDIWTEPLAHHEDISQRNWAWGIRTIDRRSQLLSAGRILEEAAPDPYSFTREAHRQKRANLIQDGNGGPNQDYRNDDLDAPADASANPAPPPDAGPAK